MSITLEEYQKNFDPFSLLLLPKNCPTYISYKGIKVGEIFEPSEYTYLFKIYTLSLKAICDFEENFQNHYPKNEINVFVDDTIIEIQKINNKEYLKECEQSSLREFYHSLSFEISELRALFEKEGIELRVELEENDSFYEQ